MSARRHRLTLLLSALLVVVEFTTISTLDRVFLSAWSGIVAPPSVEHSLCIYTVLLLLSSNVSYDSDEPVICILVWHHVVSLSFVTYPQPS